MLKRGWQFGIGCALAWLSVALLYAVASYPSAVHAFPTRVDGQTIAASWFNEIHDEVVAIENALLNGFQHDLKFTDATYDIGKSGATRPRDGFFSRNVVVGGTFTPTGNVVSDLLFTDATYDIGKSGATRPRDLFLSRNLVVGGTSTLTGNVVSDLLFTDATYDIGKSAATRPRDGFFSRNLTAGGTLGVTGASTLASPTSVGATPATAGDLRLPHNFSLQARNAASSGNARVLSFQEIAVSSAGDTLIATGAGGSMGFVRDNTNGGAAAFIYDNVGNVVLLGTSIGATTFVTGAPAAGQIQLKSNASGVAALANANRNGALVGVTWLGIGA